MAITTNIAEDKNAVATPSTQIEASAVTGINKQATAGIPTATGNTAQPKPTTTKISVPDTYNNADYANMINDMYDAQYQQGVQELENAYNESAIEYNRMAEKLPETYDKQRNTLSANYEKQKRNFNLMAAASGINTGTASQESLARLNTYQNNLATLAAAQADAQTEIDFQLATLKRQKQQQVASLLANNQIAKAQAAINAWLDGREQEQAKANVLAQYGDFSTFRTLGYSEQEIIALETAWALQNPKIAKVLNPEAYKRAFGTTATSSNTGYSYDYWDYDRSANPRDVTAIQQQLNEAGYNLKVDGLMGAKTQAAYEDYISKAGGE